MDYYVEIDLLPDPELSDTVLMNILFTKLHHALSQVGRGEIGVSFPQAKKTLGERLRLHGAYLALNRLMQIEWLKSLADHVKHSSITAVPSECTYRIVRRVQVKSSPERMYRRSIKKGKISFEEAEKRIALHEKKQIREPFLQLKSFSSGQDFRLFIQQGAVLREPQSGTFSNYGLSSGATVPCF